MNIAEQGFFFLPRAREENHCLMKRFYLSVGAVVRRDVSSGSQMRRHGEKSAHVDYTEKNQMITKISISLKLQPSFTITANNPEQFPRSSEL